MESTARNAPSKTKALPRFDTPVIVRVISYRKRKHDPEGVSVKAVLDGIVRAGILRDDSCEEIKKICFESRECEKGEKEKTIIEITDAYE